MRRCRRRDGVAHGCFAKEKGGKDLLGSWKKSDEQRVAFSLCLVQPMLAQGTEMSTRKVFGCL